MMVSASSRRAFVGTALTGAALLGPAAFILRGRGTASSADAITVVPGGRTAPMGRVAGATSPEMAHWSDAIGQTFHLTGADGGGDGVLTAVVPAATSGARPAGVRQTPFWAYFAFDAARAPKGDAIYAVDHAVAGLSEIFMQRTTDRGGRATLIALFA